MAAGDGRRRPSVMWMWSSPRPATRCAHALAIPVHVLGASEPDDATYLAMVQFAESILNLAEIARQTGRAEDAVAEVWPLVARLEARASEGQADRDTLALLGRARARSLADLLRMELRDREILPD